MALGAENIPDNYISGADELIKALGQLTPKLSRKVLFDANKTVLRKVARPDLKAVLSSFSRASKTGVTIRKAKGTQNGAYLGISTNAYWLRFVNYGTADRSIKEAKQSRTLTKRYNNIGRLGRSGGVANRGRVVGDKRISSTLEGSANAVLAEVQTNYGGLMEEALNKELQRVKIKFGKL